MKKTIMVLMACAALSAFGQSGMRNPPFSSRDISRFGILTNGCGASFSSVLLGTTNSAVVDYFPGRLGFYGPEPLFVFWDTSDVFDGGGFTVDGVHSGAGFIMQALYGGIRLLISDLSVEGDEITRVSDKEVLLVTKSSATFKVPLVIPSGVMKTNKADAAVGEFFVDGTNEVLKIKLTE